MSYTLGVTLREDIDTFVDAYVAVWLDAFAPWRVG